MLSGLIFRLSPARRRFMRELARPALARFKERLDRLGSPRAVRFITILNDANADFMAYALSADGLLADRSDAATSDSVENCLADLLVYCVHLFARDDVASDSSELIPLLAGVIATEPKRVMLKRDALRKSPRSEEWMLYTWLVKDLGGPAPAYDPELEQRFGYQYVSYIGQYRPMIERELRKAEPKQDIR
jgi:hypothetical protein